MISKKNIVIFIFILSAFINCSNEFSKYNYVNYKKLEKPRKAKKLSSVILVNKEKINLLSNFDIVDEYIITIDMKSDKLIKIFNNETGKLLKSFGRKGQGPSEFIGASDIIRDPNDKNMFWIYDLTAKEIKKFSIKKVLNGDINPEKIIKLKERISKIKIAREEKIIGESFSGNARLRLYDKEGKAIGKIGKVPIKLKDNKFVSQHLHGFWGPFIYKEKTEEIYLATMYGSIIERYFLRKKSIVTTYYGPELFFPHYSIIFAGSYYTITFDKKSRYGYIDMDYNKKTDKIFLLYSGKFFKGGIYAAFTNIVYTMNNKGELEEELILDKKVHKIRVSEDGSTIYGAGSNEILKFEYNKM